ncbi:MAG: NlpC/P60 family protein [Spirochaetota bacterium]
MPLISSCVVPALRTAPDQRQEFREREEIVRYALSLTGIRDLRAKNDSFRNDCSGFIIGVFKSMGYGIDLSGIGRTRATESMYFMLRSRGLTYIKGVPQKGDVVFFKNTTYERGGRVSHVGIVADIMRNGTVLIVHYGSAGVSKLRMNLSYPHTQRNDDGLVLNDILKSGRKGEGDFILSGELFHSYGNLYAYAVRGERGLM